MIDFKILKKSKKSGATKKKNPNGIAMGLLEFI
jgi:hypothetical protein